MMSPDYDALDAPPASELAAMTYRDSSEDAPWKKQVCYLDPSAMFPIGPRKYVRSSSVVVGDLKTYDAGILHLCTTEMANTNSVGKLWVEYDVELHVPQTVSGQSAASSSFAQFNLSANQSLTTATVATVAFDEVVSNSLGIVNAAGTFTLPAGSWEVLALVGFSGGTGTATTALLALEADDAALDPPKAGHVFVNGINQYDSMVPVQAFVTSDGTTTVRARATYTSASGTLVLTGDQCTISFRIC
jgi:hypothetical protein